jgi:stage II sporulation SpoAA-like protein
VVEPLTDMPDGTLGFQISGNLTRDDYDTMVPPLRAAIAAGEPLRVLFEVVSFEGLSADALWEDLKADATLGLGHLRSWKRLALVSDLEWFRHAIGLFGWMIPGEVRLFRPADRAEAIAWVAGH